MPKPIENARDNYVGCFHLLINLSLNLGDLELLQDEILTPTFEDIVLLWCIEKVDSSLPDKIKKNFGEQINNGTPLKELEIDIFKYLSEHYTSSTQSDRHIDDILSTVNDDFEIKHEKNSFSRKKNKSENYVLEFIDTTFNKSEIETIKQELFECQTKNNNAIDKDIPIEAIAKIECDEEVFADNVDQTSGDFSEDDQLDALNDDLLDLELDIENGKIEHTLIKEEDGENLKLLQSKSSEIKRNSTQTCDVCNKKHSSKRRLREHLESVHGKTFTCKLCQEVFSSRKDLILHRAEEHKRVCIRIFYISKYFGLQK